MSLNELKNKYRDQRCFIIGNGPSLNSLDLSLLRNEFVFSVNWFVVHKEFPHMKNLYHCISDKAFWCKEKKLYKQFLSDLKKNQKVTLFSDRSGEQIIREEAPGLMESNRCHFLTYNRDLPVWENNFNSDLEKTLCFGYTVILDFCLPIAHYLGFKSVYLVGCDCDYKLDKTKDFQGSYFFDINDVPNENLKHLRFQRDNKGSQDKTEVWNSGYRVVKDYFKKSDRNLLNAGVGGKLEALERVKFETLFTNQLK